MSDSITLNHERILRACPENFERIALDVFLFQYEHNDIYRQYCNAIGVNPEDVRSQMDIPFLPISFFKTHRVVTNSADFPASASIFESSGTTGETPSRHYVADTALYEQVLLSGFEQFYGPVQQYAILALLPSYLERKNASLVHMARVLMGKSGNSANGFYLNEWRKLKDALVKLGDEGQKTLLLGVTFALLDFADACPMPLQNVIVMETGGMKGRREELTRDEIHSVLKKAWGLRQVHSEYGMTELLSQAYATAGSLFKCMNTMRVLLRDINDPLSSMSEGVGCINIIDLANVYSCPFIATEDIGRLYADGAFEVLGRADHSALRGCSLMTA